MTPQESRLLKAIGGLTVDEVPPSYRELTAAMGLASTAGISRMLRSLKRQGFVDYDPRRARSLRIVDQGPDYRRMSLATLQEMKAAIEDEITDRLQGRA